MNPYQHVPPEQLARLTRFRETHQPRRLAIGGHEWTCLTAGTGIETVLVLPGALGTAESAWSAISRLETTRRVVSVSYPSVRTMAELADGLAAILARLGIHRVHVFGASYGGLVAQVFVRRHPGVVRRLVLSHTVCPDAERGRKIAGAMRWMAKLPMGLLRAIYRRKLTGLVPASLPETALLHAYMRDVLDRELTKELLINAYLRVADFDQHHVFAPTDLADWPGRLLLLMADDDPGTPAPVRERMQSLYPGAAVRIFQGTGHATALLRPDEYYGAIERFLAS